MNEEYKINKEWLDLMLEHKDNTNLTFKISDEDTKISLTYIEVLQQENVRLKEKIEKAKEYIEQCDWHNYDVYIGEDLLEILKEN